MAIIGFSAWGFGRHYVDFAFLSYPPSTSYLLLIEAYFLAYTVLTVIASSK
jgi:hypothetical protein